MSVRRFELSFLSSLLALLMGASASNVFAQSYKADEYDRQLGRKGQIVKKYVKDPVGNAEDAQTYRDYFAKYYFPVMTQPTERGLQNLGKMRIDLFKQFVWGAQPNVQKELSDQAFEFARGVVKSGRYHPAVTYNALLVLGQIDTRYAGPGVETPTPSAKANEFLCIVADAAVKNAKVPRLMLTGALVGLDRHAKYLASLPQSNQAKTIDTLIGILTAEQLAGDYREGVRGWIYCQAASALANLGETGADDKHFSALVVRMSDETLDFESRLKLASMLGKLKPQAGVKSADEAVSGVIAIVQDASTAERAAAVAFEDLQLESGGRMRNMPATRDKEARRFKVSVEGEVEIERSGLLSTLNMMQEATGAVQPVADEETQQKLDEVATALDEARSKVSDTENIDLVVADAIKQMDGKVKAILGEGASDEEEAEDLEL